MIVPKEAEAVRLIFRYYLEGWQITDISKEPEAEGYGSIRGKEKVIENDHEPLVSREMFDAVQKRRDSECRRWKGRERNAKCDGDTRQPE